MTPTQRAIFQFLLVVFLTLLALIVTAPTRAEVADLQPLVTTPSTTPPVLAHIEEDPHGHP